jgi:hypothetical protein
MSARNIDVVEGTVISEGARHGTWLVEIAAGYVIIRMSRCRRVEHDKEGSYLSSAPFFRPPHIGDNVRLVVDSRSKEWTADAWGYAQFWNQAPTRSASPVAQPAQAPTLQELGITRRPDHEPHGWQPRLASGNNPDTLRELEMAYVGLLGS